MLVTGKPTLKSRQHFAEGLAADAGQLALHYFQNLKDLAIESKGPRDFVSAADRLVEKMIRDRIHENYPEEGIVGEEEGGEESDAFWSIDPIDGTSNFLAGIPLWGVSIGFCQQGAPTVGVISIPTLDILLSANLDTPGILYNGLETHDRQPTSIPTMVLGQSINWETSSFREVEDIFRAADLECLSYRCSVVSIAFAVLGWTHGYYEEQTNIWDVAAGYVIAQQAGLISEISRGRIDPVLAFSLLTPEVFDLVGSDLAARKSRNNMVKMA